MIIINSKSGTKKKLLKKSSSIKTGHLSCCFQVYLMEKMKSLNYKYQC